MPYLPEWGELPEVVRDLLISEVKKISKISLKIIVGN